MDHQDPSAWPPLSRPGEPSPEEARSASKDRGIRHVRRLSNWTAAALVAATAVTAGYFAWTGASASSGTPQPVTAADAKSQAPDAQQPCVSVPVAVSGGSGVTTTTVQSSCPPDSTGTRPALVYEHSGEGREDQ